MGDETIIFSEFYRKEDGSCVFKDSENILAKVFNNGVEAHRILDKECCIQWNLISEDD